MIGCDSPPSLYIDIEIEIEIEILNGPSPLISFYFFIFFNSVVLIQVTVNNGFISTIQIYYVLYTIYLMRYLNPIHTAVQSQTVKQSIDPPLFSSSFLRQKIK